MSQNDLAGQVLWLDADLLAIQKPAGLLTLPDGYDPAAPHVRSLFEPRYGRLWIVHRLDRLTSGVLLLARNPATHSSLNDQFARREVEKIYHALVAGEPDWHTRQIELPLRTNVGRRHRTVPDTQRGKPALTELRVLARFLGCTLIEARPSTGRTHQIRAHLAAVGFPVLGDPLYGAAKPKYPAGVKLNPETESTRAELSLVRLGLHAYRLRIQHPGSGQRLQIEAPYPRDLQTIIDQLTRSSKPSPGY